MTKLTNEEITALNAERQREVERALAVKAIVRDAFCSAYSLAIQQAIELLRLRGCYREDVRAAMEDVAARVPAMILAEGAIENAKNGAPR